MCMIKAGIFHITFINPIKTACKQRQHLVMESTDWSCRPVRLYCHRIEICLTAKSKVIWGYCAGLALLWLLANGGDLNSQALQKILELHGIWRSRFQKLHVDFGGSIWFGQKLLLESKCGFVRQNGLGKCLHIFLYIILIYHILLPWNFFKCSFLFICGFIKLGLIIPV